MPLIKIGKSDRDLIWAAQRLVIIAIAGSGYRLDGLLSKAFQEES
jgi:hypothetical protein